MNDKAVTNTIPLPQKENTKLAMWLFLGGEMVFFAALILIFIFTRLSRTDYDALFRSNLSIPVIAINTFVLVTSSYFVVRALDAIGHNGDGKAMRTNLILVAVLGAAFLGGQAFEWTSLFNAGVDLSNPFGNVFFIVTGIHGTHVLVGVLWAIYVLVGHSKQPFTKEDHLGVENFGLYWHFVDIVWIVLFTVIYLI